MHAAQTKVALVDGAVVELVAAAAVLRRLRTSAMVPRVSTRVRRNSLREYCAMEQRG
jgi:hypothetical protein